MRITNVYTDGSVINNTRKNYSKNTWRNWSIFW